LSSIPEILQILGNAIGNSAMSRSGYFIKKSLKISKGQSESSYRRRRDKAMAKKKYKKTTLHYYQLHFPIFAKFQE
jgi:hypothetical protein